jgi:hypothetical protein
MTPPQIILFTCGYLALFVAAVYFTRPTLRRFMGALGGGAVVGFFGIGAIHVGNVLEMWWVPISWTPGYVLLFYLGFAISISPLYLVTWRIARRFGWRGLAVFIGAVAVIGPPRDYMYATLFPEWMVFAPGVPPLLADALAYIGIVVVGHAVMWLIAGPAIEDGLRD